MRLVFPEVRLTSVRIVWQPPEEPNGIILGKTQQDPAGGLGGPPSADPAKGPGDMGPT